MADPTTSPPLTRTSVQAAHAIVKPYIHLTPILTSTTLNTIASTPQTPESLVGTPYEDQTPARPTFNLFFKCENLQKIGAFKARGAFHAISRLAPKERAKGVITHSSGNHAQATALAARTFGIPAHIVMPSISTASKVASTRSLGAQVYFSGSTAPERLEALSAVQAANPGAVTVPPYDHPDIILGQGTVVLEFEDQVQGQLDGKGGLDAVIAPLGGGGLLAGIATAMQGTGVRVFGAEPAYQGGNDGQRGLAAGKRVEEVSTLTIADGLRTPVGLLNWTVISDVEKVRGVFSVSEEQIKAALRLVLERMKVVIEPSAAVPLAVVLFDEEFRRLVEREAGEGGWNVGVVFSGGNTTVEAIGKLFAEEGEKATA
ncbi:putative pyridoxal-phosphate dependent enzyme [Trichodelitschia bisporula]|uniref:Putative pyridoxal-phosphate dependent enzyme n=1 Tax=Trichodelitschia bisporula TaxID=703511 RepID=A0A6G1I6D0_9PEZI|nr:putative pyridoxal-phosphate dependent enzyme [Trichodelitschia bisporula]